MGHRDHRDGDRRRRRQSGIPTDPDAQLYFDAVIANLGSLSNVEKTAYNIYRTDSKNNANAWNGDALIDLPMIGGTVESMVVNAQNPGTFDQIAVNTVAGDFTATGWTPDGATSYFRMVLIPSVDLTINSMALEYYSRDEGGASGTKYFFGSNVGVGQRVIWIPREAADTTNFQAYDNANGKLQVAQVSSQGGFVMSRTGAADSRAFKSGVQYGATLGTTGGLQPNIEFFLAARNTAGVAALFADHECAGAGILDGLTPAKVLALCNARTQLNTTLLRNV